MEALWIRPLLVRSLLRHSWSRWIAAFLGTFLVALADYLIQTRIPRAGPRQAFEDSWWYKAWNWTVPPENQRDTAFWIYSALEFFVVVAVVYFLLSRWQRRRERSTLQT